MTFCDPGQDPFRTGQSLPTQGVDSFGEDCRCDCHRIPGVMHIMACCQPKILKYLTEDDMKPKELAISEIKMDEKDQITGKVRTVIGGADPSTAVASGDVITMGSQLGKSGQVFVNGVGWIDSPVKLELNPGIVSKMASVIHLLKHATITCPSVGDAELARQLLDDIAKELKQ